MWPSMSNHPRPNRPSHLRIRRTTYGVLDCHRAVLTTSPVNALFGIHSIKVNEIHGGAETQIAIAAAHVQAGLGVDASSAVTT